MWQPKCAECDWFLHWLIHSALRHLNLLAGCWQSLAWKHSTDPARFKDEKLMTWLQPFNGLLGHMYKIVSKPVTHCLTHTKYQWSQVHIVTAREWNALKTDCSSSYKFRRLLPIHRLCIDAVDLTGTALADFKRDEGSACDCTINHRIRCGKKTLEKAGCLFVVLSSQYFSFGRRYWAQPCISNI